MPFCARCGAPVGDVDRFCASCGAPTKHPEPPVDGPGAPEASVPDPGGEVAIALGAERQRSLEARGRWLLALLGLSAVTAIVSAVSIAVHIGELMPEPDLRPMTEAIQAEFRERQDAIDGLHGLANIITGVLWLTWQFRAHDNLRKLGAGNLRFSPAWGAGWWFIPIANLWQPYRAVRELWTVSRMREDGSRQKSAPLIGWWWVGWLGAAAAFLLGSGQQYEAETVAPYVTGGMTLIGGELLTVLTAAMASLIVLDVVRGQAQLHQMRAALLRAGSARP